MPALVIGSLTVEVAEMTLEYVDTATYRRRWDGTLEVEQRATFGRARVWDVQTIPQSRTDASNLEAALVAAGTVELSGDQVPGGAQTCYVDGSSIERRYQARGNTPTTDLITTRFRALGVDG